MTQLVHLPESIVRSLSTFVSNDDYHYFMNTSKELFGGLKRQSIYFSLNAVKSWHYVLDRGFRELLLRKVESGWKQIGLKFQHDIPAISQKIPLHKIVSETGAITVDRIVGLNVEIVRGVQSVSEIPMIPHIRELKIFRSQMLEDVSNLSHLSSLTIIDGLSVRDIKTLENIGELWLEGCPLVEDYAMLNCLRQKILYLKSCPNLTNVVNFSGIRTLELSHCDNLVDVSSLHGIYDLSLSHCGKVSDISGLGGHHRICLRFLHAHILTGSQILLHIPHVELINSPINDIDVLQFAKIVKLSNCPNIVDVSPLKNAKVVVIGGWYNDLSPLQDIPELEIMAHVGLEELDLNKLRNNYLKLIDCQLKDVNTSNVFSNFKHLRIFNNISIVNLIDERKIEGFLSLQSLELEFCEELTNVNGLGEIPTIKIISCKRLTNISGLGRNHHVVLRSCTGLVDVKALASVPIVTIVGCDQIIDYQCSANVPRLKVISV